MLDQIVNFSIGEWLATVFSIIYIVFAVQNKSICFVFGFISSLCWAYVSYFEFNLLFDGLLQMFYVLMSIIGLYHWRFGKKNKTEVPITHISKLDNLKLIAFGVLISVGLAWVADFYLEIDKSIADALTTGFSIIATYLLILRKIENWIYFIVCNLIYVIYIYPSQGAYLLMSIMIIFTIMAFVGYYQWRKIMIHYLDSI